MKTEPPEWEKIFANDATDKCLISKIHKQLIQLWASLVAQLVKNPPAMGETWIRPLGWEDPLEKRKATRSSILAWRILWTI